MPASKQLAVILSQRDPVKYKAIIERAALNGYHDFKYDRIPGHPEWAEDVCPKITLVDDLSQFPELNDLRELAMNGEWDDAGDEEDALVMRSWLMDENQSDAMFKMLGFKPPSSKERRKWKIKKMFN
jgi:hypothetical protein